MMSPGTPRQLLSRQKGAALLAYLLVVIAASSYFLVNKLNANIIITRGVKESRAALNLARQALIGYAVSYPDRVNGEEGPGYLPCPDRDYDGDAEGNCSNSNPNYTTIGRLPYETLELPELRDSSGQRLWYILSENFRGGANKTIPLNSESPAQAELSLNNTNDIVAVIIAPGEPVGTQDRDPAQTNIITEITNYLEDENNDLDTSFVTSAAGDFNDIVVAITRGELMRAVEKRVIGEISQVLTTYNNIYGAFPWLTVFADPKATVRSLRNTHNGADNAADLTDSTVNFNDWGITAGDVVRNLTDGSMGTVTTVSANTLTIGAGLNLGTENDFDDDDKYVVHINSHANTLAGVATIGSNNLSLEDNTKDFDEVGVAAGDIVQNLTDGSSGMVETVSSTELTLKTLTGGAGNNFDVGDSYKIRTNMGIITTADDDADEELNLIDANTNFAVMGVQVGELVINETDGSFGFISAIPPDTANNNTITIDELNFGTDNDFDAGDNYTIPRYNSDDVSREGLMSFHDYGESFKTDFSMEWYITAANGATVNVNLTTPNPDANYQAALTDQATGASVTVNTKVVGSHNGANDAANLTDTTRNFITLGVTAGDIVHNTTDDSKGTVVAVNANSLTLGNMSLGTDDDFDNGDEYQVYSTFGNNGKCTWLNEQVVECQAYYEDLFLQGTVTAGNNSVFLIDSTKNFNAAGIKPGDIIQNYDDATFVASGTADTGSGELLLVDTDVDFSPFDPAALNNFVIWKNGVDTVIAIVDEIIPGPNAGESNTLSLRAAPADAALTFAAGDTWQAYSPQRLVVASVNSNTTLYTVTTTGAAPDFDGGLDEFYRILTATGSLAGTADGASAGTLLEDTTADFSDIEVGDIIENITDGSFGRIATIPSTTTLTAQLYLPTNPYSTTTRNFNVGEQYIIHHDYVGKRRYDFELLFSGTSQAYGSSGVRNRDVCIGYENLGVPDCTNAASRAVTTLPLNNGIPAVTITDYYDVTETTAATATVTVTGATSGSIKVTGIDYYLNETTSELPEWFVKNNWHQLVYIAYSADYAPGGAADCVTSGNCLTLEQTDGISTLDNNVVGATVFISGEEIQTERDSGCTAVVAVDQSRADATLNEYFELENCDTGDDVFQQVRLPSTQNFNDQSRIVN